MHPNETLLQTFYSAFQKRDHQTMASCYHPEAHFYDEVFQDLNGWKIGAMWRMLCENGKDLEIEFRDLRADEQKGSGHWDARYTFSATKRKILNQIDATFVFKDGKIFDHRDQFDLKRWLRMAFGPLGFLLGGTRFFQSKFRAQAKERFESYIRKNGLGPS